MNKQPATDAQVESYILQVLDDFKEYDWDDAMELVDDGFERTGMTTELRQVETCLANLVTEGKIVENWDGDWCTLRRVKSQVAVSKQQPTLFGPVS